MLTYEISRPLYDEPVTDELWRLEFRAPVGGHDNVLVWADNVPRDLAICIQDNWDLHPEEVLQFCSRCVTQEDYDAEHGGHDLLPEERGWRYAQLSEVRAMPMREAL